MEKRTKRTNATVYKDLYSIEPITRPWLPMAFHDSAFVWAESFWPPAVLELLRKE